MTPFLAALLAAAAAAAPPPAYATAAGRTVRLATGSYCWGTRCVDKLPPAGRTDLPRLRVARGATVVLRLAFVPRRWTATVLGSGQTETLPRARTATWRARRSGILALDVHAAAGSVGYLARVAVR